MRSLERLGYVRACLGDCIQAHGHDEHPIARHHVRALICEIPLEPEITFLPGCTVGGDHGDEERAVVDLAPDLLVPGVPAAQSGLIEPDFESGRAKRCANPLGRRGIL